MMILSKPESASPPLVLNLAGASKSPDFTYWNFGIAAPVYRVCIHFTEADELEAATKVRVEGERQRLD